MFYLADVVLKSDERMFVYSCSTHIKIAVVGMCPQTGYYWSLSNSQMNNVADYSFPMMAYINLDSMKDYYLHVISMFYDSNGWYLH